jgi:cytochrome b561
MADTSPLAQDSASPGARQGPAPVWGRADAVLFAVAVTTTVAIAVQFALAGFGAFAMDKTPTDNAYGAHAVLGMVIALLELVVLITVLASRPARAHRLTLRLAIALAVLAIPVQPLLGSVGQKAAALGALHALNGLIIFALTGWLTGETARRRAAARRSTAAA